MIPKHRFHSDKHQTIITTIPVKELKYLLDNFNDVNRPVSSRAVKMYKNDIMRGGWILDGIPICFNTSGQLMNGQHRMMAHVDLDMDMYTFVSYGILPEAIKTIDNRPNSRSYAQNMAIEHCLRTGETMSKELVSRFKIRHSIAKEICHWDGHPDWSDTQVEEASKSTIKPELDFVLSLPILNKHAKRPGILSAIALYYRRDKQKAMELLTHVVGDGSNVPSGTILDLRNYINEGSIGGSQRRYDHNVTVKAIHHHYFGTASKNRGNKKVSKEWTF